MKSKRVKKIKFNLPLSFSSIHTYDTCPLAFDLRRRGASCLKGLAAERGNALHELIAAYLGHLKAVKLDKDDEYFRKLYYQTTAKLPESVKQDFDSCIERLLDITVSQNFFDNGRVELNLAVNNEFKAVEYESPDAILRGRIDYLEINFLNKTVTIKDWKSNFKIPSQAEIEKRNIQLCIYAVLAAATYLDIKTFNCEFNYIRYGAVRRLTIQRSEIPYLQESIAAKIVQIQEAAEFPACPSSACGYCGYINSCPEYLKAKEQSGVIAEPKDAEKAAADLRFLRIKVADLESQLKDYCETNGNIDAGDEVLGYSAGVKISYDSYKVFKELQDRGINDVELISEMNIGKAGIKRLFKNNLNKKDFTEFEATFGIPEISTTFRFKKKEPQEIEE